MQQQFNHNWDLFGIHSSEAWLVRIDTEFPEVITQAASAMQTTPHAGLPPWLPDNMLTRINEALYDGIGFIVLRTGSGTDEAVARTLFLAIGQFFGDNVSRDALGNECDWLELKSVEDPHFGGVYSGNAFHDQTIGQHVDGSGDDDRIVNILGLMCAAKAASGGESIISNVAKAINDLPHHTQQLLQQSWLRTHPYEARDVDTMRNSPIVSYSESGKLVQFSYHFQRLRNAMRQCGEPEHSEHFKALDQLEEALNKHSVRFTLEPGDLLFLNNQTLAHARAGFTNHADNPRRLLRLWVGKHIEHSFDS